MCSSDLQILPGTALTVSTGRPICSLSFPAAGGIQGIDALGAVLPLVGATGSLIPAADNVDDLGTLALRWRVGFFGTTVSTPAIGVPVAGVVQAVATISSVASAVNGLDIASAATGNAPSISAVGSDTDINLTVAAKGAGILTVANAARVVQTVQTSGAQSAFKVTGAANTGVTAATQATDVLFNLERTVTWAAGAGPLAAQRAFYVKAPLYAGDAGDPLTITNAATLCVSGAPGIIAGLNISNSYALWIESGASLFGGSLSVGGAPVATAALTVTSTTQGFLPPRMTEAERDAIGAPAAGLIVYNTTTNKLNFRAAAAWEVVTSV